MMGPFGRTVPAEDGRLILMDAAANLRSVIQTIQEQEARGGHWERICGGLLFVFLPPGADFDPSPWVETA